jgi:hypothetical protein
LKKKINEEKDVLNRKKKENDHKTLRSLNEQKKIDQINSSPLKKYYGKTNNEVESLCSEIDAMVIQLKKYRGKGNIQDILLLQERKKTALEDYKILPSLNEGKDNE